jgi:hypothetical protein
MLRVQSFFCQKRWALDPYCCAPVFLQHNTPTGTSQLDQQLAAAQAQISQLMQDRDHMLALLAQADAEKAAAETAAAAAHASNATWAAAEQQQQQQPRSSGGEEQLQAQLQVGQASAAVSSYSL